MVKFASTIQDGNCSTTYTGAEDSQHSGVLRVVCDLHEGHKGQLLISETLAKVIRDKDPRALASGHFCCEDHLQARVQKPQSVKKQDDGNEKFGTCSFNIFYWCSHNEKVTYFSRVFGADGDTKLWSDERVVNEVSHILKWLPVVLTGRQNSELNGYQLQTRRHSKQVRLEDLPSIKFGLPESHQ